MRREPGRKPPLEGRGVLPFEDFCRASGLDSTIVENLMRTDFRDISMWRDQELTQPLGIFDEALPSQQALAALGLPVRDDYNPDALRSYVEDGDEDEESDDDAGPTWTMTW